MEDEKTYMLFFDKDAQQFIIINSELQEWPMDKGFPVAHTDSYRLIFLLVQYLQTKIDAGEVLTFDDVTHGPYRDAEKFFRDNGLGIKQFDGSYK